METTGTQVPSAKDRRRHWLRVLRPLTWWCYFVFFLFLLHTHERLSANTHLYFSINFQGRELWFGQAVLVDGREAMNGQGISIGRHTLTVEFPKAEPFQTNFFVWYGSNGLGALNLNRAYGFLDIKAEPKARLLTISGPEFRQGFTNFSGQMLTVPTDDYSIEAKYANWEGHDQAAVFFKQTAFRRIAPRLGAIALTCNRDDATFELVGPDNRLIESGTFPATIVELPEGAYHVNTRHHKFQWENSPSVKAGVTNNVPVEIAYGKVLLETEPSGASVTTSDGRSWGYTPLKIDELPVGKWSFTLNEYAYEIATVTMDVAGDQTVTLKTNLISRNYTAEMESARQYFQRGDYDRALQAAGNALLAKRDDSAALKLQREAGGFANLQRAKGYGKQGDFISGIKQLEMATNALQENGEAIQLLADFKTREPEQREKMRLERLNRGEVVFKNALARQTADDLFERYELKTKKPFAEVEAAISRAFRNDFRVYTHESKLPNVFDTEAIQEFKTSLGGNAGKRVVVIAGAQVTDEDTQILFKVLEYKTEAVNKLSIGNLLGVPDQINYVPIHPSRIGTLTEKLKDRVNEGTSNVTMRIQTAVGQIVENK